METYQIVGLSFIGLLLVLLIVKMISSMIGVYKNGIPKETNKSKKWSKAIITFLSLVEYLKL